MRPSSRKSRTILSQKKELATENTGKASDGTKPKADQTAGGEKTVVKHKKAAYLQSLNESEKIANFKIIDNMNKRINFLRNPRYKSNKAPITLNKVELEYESKHF